MLTSKVMIKKIIVVLHACVVFCKISAKADTFADIFKPIKLEYLYNLVDKHQDKQDELDAMFKIKKKYNVKKQKNKRVLAYSLFWKAPLAHATSPQTINGDTIHQAASTIKGGGSFYSKYVGPLIKQLRIFRHFFPGWIARVYLAEDLEFLLPMLIKPDVEVFVMASNSLAASPGAMWRFLVLDDPDVRVAYIRDADKLPKHLNGDFAYNKHILRWINDQTTKGFFRARDFGRQATRRIINAKYYSPIVASSFGAKDVHWIKMKKAMQGYILHRTLFPHEPRHPRDVAVYRHPYGFGNEFPSYGFDERFLKHVIYFEAVERKELATISTDRSKADSHSWIKLDMKYIRDKALARKNKESSRKDFK